MATADRKEREKEQRKNAIIDAAEKLFFSRSFDSVPMEEIAKEVELGKGTLYLYFKNKDALFFAITLRKMRKMHEILVECIELEISGREKHRLIGKKYFEFVQENQEYYRMICAIGPKLFRKKENEDMKAVMEQIKEDLLLNRDVLKEGMEDGTIRNDIDPFEMAFIMNLMCNSIICLDPNWKKILEIGGISYDQFVKDFLLFIGNALDNRPVSDEMGLGNSAR
ncbi:TPA: TetR/AcrR family transcriptional regulator [Methanosarcina acetivorans]|nr:TetR/AcrR family transcriptional regulator [Methanosarcina acetivorans]HIH92483.1 TetR/AcrR family transcriptional regulator [Methanosarcina acetivorans]